MGNLFLIHGKQNAYCILDLFHNCSKPVYCTLVVLVSWSSMRDPDILSDNNLIIPCWLCVVEVICQVVECRYPLQFLWLFVPDNVDIPPGQCISTFLSTPVCLELMKSCYAMLAIDEPPVLNQVPIFWFLGKQVSVCIDGRKAHLMPLVEFIHLQQLISHSPQF